MNNSSAEHESQRGLDYERRLSRLEVRLEACERQLERRVTTWEFFPVRLLVYGFVGVLLTYVILWMLRAPALRP